MKKLLTFLAVITITFYSCEKADMEEPGKIPGMGETPGELQVDEPFVLTDGINLIGEITGIDDDAKSVSLNDSKRGSYYYGSGGEMITLKLTLLNTSDSDRTALFPRGLLWKSTIEGYQHALLLQTTWVTLKANEQRTVYLHLYCINYGRLPSDAVSTFEILGVASSKYIKKLLNYIGWRKINYEMIYGTQSGKKGGAVDTTDYEQIRTRLQTIIWNLTNNGVGITESDKEFIENIPELDESQQPDIDGSYPDYFEEFYID